MDRCPICNEGKELISIVNHLTSLNTECTHRFCSNCIDRWHHYLQTAGKTTTCPLCRKVLRVNGTNQPSEEDILIGTEERRKEDIKGKEGTKERNPYLDSYLDPYLDLYREDDEESDASVSSGNRSENEFVWGDDEESNWGDDEESNASVSSGNRSENEFAWRYHEEGNASVSSGNKSENEFVWGEDDLDQILPFSLSKDTPNYIMLNESLRDQFVLDRFGFYNKTERDPPSLGPHPDANCLSYPRRNMDTEDDESESVRSYAASSLSSIAQVGNIWAGKTRRQKENYTSLFLNLAWEDAGILEFTPGLRTDRDFMDSAVKKNPEAIRYVDENIDNESGKGSDKDNSIENICRICLEMFDVL